MTESIEMKENPLTLRAVTSLRGGEVISADQF